MREDIAATLAAIRADHDHGASYLTTVAAGLIERIATAAQRGSSSPADALALLIDACRGIALARPGMASLVGLACRACQPVASGTAEAALQQALTVAQGLRDPTGQQRITQALAERIGPGAHIVTLSRSGTVSQALQASAAQIAQLTVLESRPGGEGVAVATEFATLLPGRVWLLADAAYYLALADATACVVGADALLAAGTFVNKTGTHPLALCAQALGVPVYVVTERVKIAPASWHWQPEVFDPALLLATPVAGLQARAEPFEQVPLALVTVLTEAGELSRSDLTQEAEALDMGLRALDLG